MASPTAAVMWFRRDLRLGDNPALLEACSDGAVLPLFVVDDTLWRPSGGPRRVYLAASLHALDESLRELGGRLVLTHGDPVSRVVAAAREVDARRVHIAADYGPYGARRDEATERALAEHDIELVVLARYMQILSPELCEALAGKVVNIHHSFLPGFKGANPYRQAHSRGVKLIGATAHFVTSDLDEGPIIEQNVRRVDHTMEVPQLVAMGQEQESRTLTEAVKLFAEHRVLLDGGRTVIFR